MMLEYCQPISLLTCCSYLSSLKFIVNLMYQEHVLEARDQFLATQTREEASVDSGVGPRKAWFSKGQVEEAARVHPDSILYILH